MIEAMLENISIKRAMIVSESQSIERCPWCGYKIHLTDSKCPDCGGKQ